MSRSEFEIDFLMEQAEDRQAAYYLAKLEEKEEVIERLLDSERDYQAEIERLRKIKSALLNDLDAYRIEKANQATEIERLEELGTTHCPQCTEGHL